MGKNLCLQNIWARFGLWSCVLPAQSIAVRKDLLVQIFHNFFLVLEFLKLIVWNLKREKKNVFSRGVLKSDKPKFNPLLTYGQYANKLLFLVTVSG